MRGEEVGVGTGHLRMGALPWQSNESRSTFYVLIPRR
jgi:hypothetical protein